jgi:hypothetical protein
MTRDGGGDVRKKRRGKAKVTGGREQYKGVRRKEGRKERKKERETAKLGGAEEGRKEGRRGGKGTLHTAHTLSTHLHLPTGCMETVQLHAACSTLCLCVC